MHVKRIHEYKRQLLNVLHVITLYRRIKRGDAGEFAQRTVIFGGKAAPAYRRAKLIIKLINSVAEVVNADSDVRGRLRVVFLPNYCVSQAEKLIAGADLSEQISTAGMEASGTGNMKFAINGALTIGTLDGANVEILEEVGGENIFIFGLSAEEVAERRRIGHFPRAIYESDPELKETIDSIADGTFSDGDRGLFAPIVDSLLNWGDNYLVLADFHDYLEAQVAVGEMFKDSDEWARRSILNTASMGKFSSDRAVSEYARDIWGVAPLEV